MGTARVDRSEQPFRTTVPIGDDDGVNDLPTITAGSVRVEVDPVAGGRIAQITVGRTPLLVGRDAAGGNPLAWGAYPMVPWAGRIRNGRFDFRGTTYELPCNHEGHAMHGVGFTSAWAVTGHSASRIDLHLGLPSDASWPFGGDVRQVFEVDDGGLTCTMVVSADGRAFPVSFGWHPWFRKPSRFDFTPTAMYRRDDDHIAVDELVDVPPGPWDDCFVNDAPIGMEVDGIAVTLTSPCTNWVVYDEPPNATCVEPQTGPPDAFTIRPEIVEPRTASTTSFRLEARET
jgi:aldose 1-epimerase